MAKRPFTYEPADPAYRQHWRHIPSATGERVVRVVPGTAKSATGGPLRPKQQVNVRFTDQGNVYVDPVNAPVIGPVAKLANRGLEAGGLNDPRVYSMEAIGVTENPNRISVSTPDLELQLNPNRSTKRPVDMTAGEQLRNLAQLLRG